MAEQSNRIQFLKDALKKLATAVREVSKGLIDLDKIVSKITGSTREMGKEAEKASKGINKLNKAQKENATNTSKADKANKGLFSSIGKNLKTIVSFYGAYQVLNLALVAFRELTIGSAKRAIALEKSLGDLAAVAGLTTEEVGRLKDVVFDVAGATSLTATEVVALQKELAKLGTSVEDIENLTRPIALLSQALGEDPGGVAATLKKTLNMFQATTEEADRFANILTGAVNESALTLQDLGTALGYVGPLGRQLGVSFEETAALLGILADNGFKANKAGTGLRQFFISAAKDGRPFNEFLEDIANRNLDVTEAVQLFNKTGASQALILGENVERFKQLSQELTQSDRLFIANAKQMATTQGQLDLLASAYDKLSTRIGEVIIGTNAFIDLIAVLDNEAAGLAQSYKFIAKASKETAEEIDNLREQLRLFGTDSLTAGDEAIGLGQAFGMLQKSGDFSSFAIRDVLFEVNYELDRGATLYEAFEAAQERGFFGAQRLASATLELFKALKSQAQGQDDAFIAMEANNDVVKRYGEDYRSLVSLTEEGINVDKEKAHLQKQINEDISKYSDELKKLRSNQVPTSEEQENIKILEKRIALLKDQAIKTKNLEVSEETLASQRKKADKEAQDRFKTELSDLLSRIKETEKAIADLPEGVSDKVFMQQVDLLTGFFGSSEDVIAQAKERFGADSDFVKGLIKTFEKATQDINVKLPSAELPGLSMEELKQELKDAITAIKEQEKLIKEGLSESISAEQFLFQVDLLTALFGDAEDIISEAERLYGENSQFVKDLKKVFKDAAEEVSVGLPKATKSTLDLTTKSLLETIDFIKNNLKEFEKIKLGDVIEEGLKTAADALSNFNDVALENTTNRLEAEKDAISNRYSVEEDILRSQLDNQLITESQFRTKQLELRRAQIAKENSIDKKIFDSEKKKDKQDAGIDYLVALASIVPTLIAYDKTADPVSVLTKAAITGGLATVAFGAEIAAINQRKFFPKQFAEGGMVNGPSHDQGGVPFSVQGTAGYEMEGGEFIVNKRATSMHRDLLERINDSHKVRPLAGAYKFAQGGLVTAQANESVDYLKAIAEATTSTAIQTSKPVRAFVSSKDLRSNETERRLRDRNDRI